MMAKLGFKPGAALGAPSNPNARTEPLGISVKEDKGGVGMLNERKRKFREEAEGAEKKLKAEEGGYRERVSREREEKRVEGMFGGAMRVLEGLEQPEGGENVPVKKVNVLWRGVQGTIYIRACRRMRRTKILRRMSMIGRHWGKRRRMWKRRMRSWMRS